MRPKRLVFAAGSLVVAFLSASVAGPGALANHCPREFGSRCCWPTKVDPHPASRAGWFWVCDYPDGCHHRCFGDIAPEEVAKDHMGRPILISKRTGNTVVGSCSAYASSVANGGVTHADGTTHPGWAGSTDPQWTVTVSYKPVRPRTGDAGQSCFEADAAKIDLAFDVDVVRWIPPDPPNYVENACDKAYKEYQQRVRSHEAMHVTDVKQLLAETRKRRPIGGMRFCAGDVAVARTGMEGALAAARDALLKELHDTAEAKGKDKDRDNPVRPMDCGPCSH